MRLLILLAALCLPSPLSAQARLRSVLFVGNSFTFGFGSPVRGYRAGSVVDLNGDGVGGVPALFRTFAQQAGLDYAVSLETSGGRGLDWHWNERRRLIDRRWDVVVLQGYSTLDANRPGDPDSHVRHAGLLAKMAARANPAVDVELVATWTRADQTFRPGGRWYGQPVTAMADDLERASEEARRRAPEIRGVVPVGRAWSRAIQSGVADANPYDGIDYGRLGLWTWDHYHASTAGYYLEALVIFGRVTGVDPRTLGERERAADELGLSPDQARALQRIAWEALQPR